MFWGFLSDYITLIRKILMYILGVLKQLHYPYKEDYHSFSGGFLSNYQSYITLIRKIIIHVLGVLKQLPVLQGRKEAIRNGLDKRRYVLRARLGEVQALVAPEPYCNKGLGFRV